MYIWKCSYQFIILITHNSLFIYLFSFVYKMRFIKLIKVFIKYKSTWIRKDASVVTWTVISLSTTINHSLYSFVKEISHFKKQKSNGWRRPLRHKFERIESYEEKSLHEYSQNRGNENIFFRYSYIRNCVVHFKTFLSISKFFHL